MLQFLEEQDWSWLDAWLLERASFVFFALTFVVFVLVIALIWSTGRGSRHIAAQRRLGEWGERRAVKILKRDGYRIVDSQVTQSYQIEVDGKRLTVRLRADFLVEKAGRTFIAEAKSGEASAQVSGRATRRQLLEYLYAFEVSGVLLVYVNADVVCSVCFPQRRS